MTRAFRVTSTLLLLAVACAFFALWLAEGSGQASESGVSDVLPALSAVERVVKADLDRRDQAVDSTMRSEIDSLVVDSSVKPRPEDGRSMRVRVIDDLGTPVTNAAIGLDGGHGDLDLGRTGADGSLDTMLRGDWSLEEIVWAKAPGFACSWSPTSEEQSQSLTLVLHPSGVIRGRVTWTNGERVGAGVQVHAIAADQLLPSVQAVSRWTRRATGSHTSTTDNDGNFELDALDAAKSYSLLAAIRGCVSANCPSNVRVGVEDVELRLGTVHGVRFEFVDRLTKAPASLPERLLQPETTRLTLPPGAASPIMFHPRWLRCAGVDRRWTDETENRGPAFFFVASPDHATTGPIAYSVRLPGFEGVLGECMAVPVDDAPAVHQVELAARWQGEPRKLRIRFEGLPRDLPSKRFPVLPEGRFSIDRAGGRLTVALGNLGPAPEELTLPVEPSSTCRIRAFNSPSSFSLRVAMASADPAVGASTQEVVADMSASGALLLALLQIDGSAYGGPALVRFDRELEGGARSPSQSAFSRGPFAFVALTPGEYRVRLISPAPADSAERTVVVRAGQTARTEITIR